ncbi:hypothetical protein DPMN_018195 [Dreissena polymorpha]|uniref:Uncharacterized protein n=1 Tax=Dreissena polymorpha TaxID=45954 RepID=A0A9D4NG84_DREPO|nr:hypothetical protein DPMN_018195 [Dreissena polymorpha]
MRRYVLWRLIWIQTVCKGLQNLVPALKGLMKKMKEAKEEWIEEKCFIINKKMTACSSKKTLMKTVIPRPVLYQMLTGIYLPRVPQSKTARWTKYCSDRYPLQQNSNDPRPEANNKSPSILKAEMEEAVRILQAEKS